MQIESIEIKNYRLFRHAKLSTIPRLCVLVGANGTGKSTLLEALELGVYNHITGDGREYVITEDTAMKIRAEDGRSIRRTDISQWISNLPNGKDTTAFSTEDASGSTSQAAGVVEATLTTNPGIAERTHLTAGTVVQIVEPATPKTRNTINLWD